ncbi:MAG: diguanylate cyclase [Acidobacteria bacterium]|nr:diguanylate cyclase [Acidobacteriota bacterium]
MRLNSVKSRVLVFALLATVIPSLTTVRVSYVHNRESLFDKVTTELNSVSSHGARENDLWLKERFYDVRVFSNSPEVWENIQAIQRARARNVSDSDSLDRLETYLAAVRDRFDDYAALTVLDSGAEVLARTGSLSRLKLPDDWLSRVAIGEELRGDAYWDDAQARYVLDIARPIRGPQGTFLGVMAAQVNFHSVGESLRAANIGPTGHVYLMGHDGRLLISSRVQQVNIVDKALPATTVELLNEVASLEYAGARGLWVIGTLDKVPLSDWVVVAEIETAEAFEPIIELRNQTIIVLVGLLLTVGLLAYLFSLIIVRPLGRLNAAAAEVASGNLNVEVPVVSHDELGYLTRIFNDMVTQIRQSRDKLEKLSITDGLTGLFNRSHMMETLKAEVARCKRGETSFAVLMLDIDNFKDYNDAFGHLAGDEVLNKMGVILRESSREMDYVARYGGEEFLVLLPDSTLDGCVEVAERIRERLGQERYSTGPETRVSISIGAAEFPRHGDSAEAIIKAADAALYEAKRAGRDRVVEASPDNVVPDDEMPLESPASA